MLLTGSFFGDVKPMAQKDREWESKCIFAQDKLMWTVLLLNPCGILWQALAKFCAEMGCAGASCGCVAVSIVRKGFPGRSLAGVRPVHALSPCPAFGVGTDGMKGEQRGQVQAVLLAAPCRVCQSRGVQRQQGIKPRGTAWPCLVNPHSAPNTEGVRLTHQHQAALKFPSCCLTSGSACSNPAFGLYSC